MAVTAWKTASSVVEMDYDWGIGADWQYPERAKVKDGSGAYNNTGDPVYTSRATKYLVATNFNFGLTPYSRIDGIEIRITRKAGIGSPKDYKVWLRNGPLSEFILLGDNQAKSTIYTTSYTSVTYGGSTNLMGAVLDFDIVDDYTFGMLFQAKGNQAVPNGASVGIDCIEMRVYYTEPTFSLEASLPASKNLNEEFDYTLTLQNTNNIAPNADFIHVNIVLPAGMIYVSQSSSSGRYSTSTGEWITSVTNGVATITLRLKSSVVGTRPINASCSLYQCNSSTRNINIIAPDNDITIIVTAPETMELTESYDVTIALSGKIYNTNTNHIQIELPERFIVSNHALLSTSNVSNVLYTNGILTFNLTSISSYDFSLSYKITVTPYKEGNAILTAYCSETGAHGSANISVVFTQDVIATGYKIQIKEITEDNAIGYTDLLQATASGTKISIANECTAKADIIKGYIGPIELDRIPSSKGLTNTTENPLIKENFGNRTNLGKEGNYSENLPLKIRLPIKDTVTLQGLVALDEPVPINANISAKDADPLNHIGYIVIHKAKISYLNNLRYECDIEHEYLTRNLNPAIYVNRLGQINKYNIKPLYPVEVMNSLMSLNEYFDIESDGLINNKTITLSELERAKFTGKNIISTPAKMEYTWNSNASVNIERIIRILDEENNKLLEYVLSPKIGGGENVEAYISVFNYDGSVDPENYEVDLKYEAGQYSTVTTVRIDENVVYILEEGATGVALSVDSLILEPGNYRVEVEIRHVAAVNSVTTVDFNIDETHLLTDEKSYFINQVVSSFSLRDKVLMYTRQAEDGLLYYYRHDETVSKYYAQPFVFYKGGVNVTTEAGGSLLNNYYNVDPICLTNGLTKVMFSFRFRMIWVYTYDPLSEEDDKWILVERLRLINMENINIKYINREKGIIEVGGTEWIMYSGRRSIDIVHPEQDIYTVDGKNTIWHDDGSGAGIEETLTDNETSISLNNLFYLLFYNQEEKYGLQVLRPDYSAISNKKIPRNVKTVLIPYKRDAKEHDLPSSLAIEWKEMYEQKITIKG